MRGAKECRDSIQAQCERSESVMRITITRKILFQDSDSKLKQCLEIVCGDDRSRSAEVQQVMTDLFIRKKHEISEENLDKKRIDDYVDDGWDRAADQMEENKEPVDRYVKLVGGRRGNIVNAMKRALVCICEWLDVVKKSTNSENEYANRLYLEERMPSTAIWKHWRRTLPAYRAAVQRALSTRQRNCAHVWTAPIVRRTGSISTSRSC